MLYQADWAHVPETYGTDWYALHRADLHQELRHLATNPPEGIKSADLKFGKRVVSVDCEQGIINFEDGKRIQKDIVVGADGLHVSASRSEVPEDTDISKVRRCQVCFGRCTPTSSNQWPECFSMPCSVKGHV